MNQALLEFKACMEGITSQRDSIQRDIDNTIRKLHEELELRKREFTEQLQEIANEKIKTLTGQWSQVEIFQTQLRDALAFTDRHISTGSQDEILTVTKLVIRKSVELVNSYSPDLFVPLQTANMIFKPERLEEGCMPYRGVCIACVCPPKCQVSSVQQPLEATFTNTLTTVVVHPKDENGADYFKPLKNVTAVLMSLTDTLQCQVDRHTNGTYVVSYTPKFPKRYSLCIRISGTHVQGSPFTVLVKRSSSDVVMNPRVLKGLKRPCGIACNSKGEVVVVERGLHMVSVYALGGSKLVRRFGSHGTSSGQFKDPDGVTVDGSDNVLVVDSGNHRIQKFTAEGEFITTVGTKGDGPMQFNFPTSIRIHPQSGNMYVCDQYNHRIQILKEDFSFVSSFGKEGSEDGDFLYPTDLAFDSIGNVFVSNTQNNCIQIFDADGHLLRRFTDGQEKEINFPFPSYICITSDETMYIADSTDKLYVYSTDGVFIGSICKEERPNMQSFGTVHGIAVDSDGKIYTANYVIGTIQVF